MTNATIEPGPARQDDRPHRESGAEERRRERAEQRAGAEAGEINTPMPALESRRWPGDDHGSTAGSVKLPRP
jgi:hypothetical protein